MTKHEAQMIASAINGSLGRVLGQLTAGDTVPAGKLDGSQKVEIRHSINPTELDTKELAKINTQTIAGLLGDNGSPAFEALYQKIKRRLLDECRVDPILLHLLTSAAPEVMIEIEPRVETIAGDTLKGRILRLAKDGFFKQSRSQAETNRELRRTGPEAHSGRLSEAFSALVNDGYLTREGDGFQIAPGVKFTEKAAQVV